jgi:hypothetical protein
MKHLPSWYKITEQEYAWARLCGYEIHYNPRQDRVTWWLNGKPHRTDGPASEWANGSRDWWLNGKTHRTDGPALEWANGDRFWFLNGKRHRTDGPASEWAAGSREWWLNGDRVTEEEFDEALAQLV